MAAPEAAQGEASAPEQTAPSATDTARQPGPEDDVSLTPRATSPVTASAPPRIETAEIRPLAPPPRVAVTLSAAAVEALLRKAKEKIGEADILSARLLFERAAAAGNEEGMMGAGSTYDPDFLRTVDAPGLKGDRSMAIQWYRRAVDDFGTRLARERIEALAEASTRH